MEGALATALATIIAGAIAGVTGWATARASARGSVKAAQVTSLAKIEEGAAQRAAGVYEGAIKRLEAERAEDRQEISELTKKDRESQRKITGLERQVETLKEEVRACLAKCKRLELRTDGDSSIGP